MRGSLVRGFIGGFVGLLMLALAQPAFAADNPLQLFKNYFGTIETASAGQGIRGTGQLDPVTGESLATATLNVPVPPQADILAAFVYWMSLEKTGKPSSARAYLRAATEPDDVRTKILGYPVGAEHAAPCWSSGGSTGSSAGAPTLRVYRADVLRYLPTNPGTGKKVPNVKVMIRDIGGNGSKVPQAEGVSLVVVYRHPALPFKSVVIFDGSFTMNNATDTIVQRIDGFYQASTTNPSAKVTFIVGDGQANFPERVWLNNVRLNGVAPGTTDNPFVGGAGYSWDNLTYENVSVTPGSSSVIAKVDHASGSFDCLSWGAMVFSTTVQDSDEDGLLDAWEEKGGFMTVPTQTNKIPFKVDLYAMGARKDQKDLFVQIDYMQEFANGDGVAEHAHLPRKEALDMVGDAFLKAPAPPNGPGPIHVHFDVGNNYQAALPKDADPYIIPFAGGLAKGGNVIDERSKSTYCGTASDCAFPNQAGLVSWKKGIQHIKNNFFPEERFGIFHYVLFGHALAMTTKEEREKGPPYALKSISGRADLPGDTVVVTLGRWRSAEVDKYVGSKDLQAATLLHELAHNLWGFHGGITFEFDRPLTISDAIVPRPNCNPNKQSVLNYLYQSAGLLDASGKFSVDLSREVLTAPDGAQDENALNEFLGIGAGNSFYRLRWYALFDDVLDRLGVQISPAKAHCNGTPIIDGEPNMVRVDNFGVTRKPVDWNYDKNGVGSPHLDINFDGDSNVATEFMDKTTDFKGFNDWLAIVNLHGLQQVGTGRNIYGLSLKVIGEDLLQLGEDDLGEDDLGEPNTPGQPTLGEDDLGEDDLGEDDLGEDDLGEDDLGDRDIDETTALAIGVAPTGLTGVPQSGRNRGILLTWNPLAFGEVAKYSVYRAVGQELTTLTKIGEVDAGPTPSFLDTNTRNNQWYTYVVTATFNETVQSNLSNPVTVRQ